MSATGIGAAVRRKEDHRFITGKGHYTDDINRPGQAFAYFVRSPHAHATIKSIDAKAAAAMPGVLAVLTGAELAADKIGNLICGWMIHSKDGSPMKMAPHPALANGKACHVGDPVAVVVAETLAQARDAAEKVKVDYAVLPAVADPAAAQKHGRAANPRHRAATTPSISGISATPKRSTPRSSRRKHVTKLDIVNNRLVPNAIEPRAAIGDYDAGTGELHAVEHDAEPARGAARHRRLRRHGAGAQAARDRARRRRRLRLEDFHLSRGSGGAVGVEARRPAGEMGRPTAPKRSSPTRTAAITSRMPRWRSTPTARSSACAPRPIANLGAYMSTFSSSVPTYLYATLLSGQYEIPQIYCEVDAVYTNTVPVDAYRGAGRPEATFVVERLVEVGAREIGPGPGRAAAQEFRQKIPAPDAGDHELRRRRL